MEAKTETETGTKENVNEKVNGTTNTPHDLLLILDATYSMTNYISALNKSLPEIIAISALTGAFERIGVIAYRDYEADKLTEWSGWCCPSGSLQAQGKRDGLVHQDDVLSMAKSLWTGAGTDLPEASKTGLALAHQMMRKEATTLIMLYADAAPHFEATGGEMYTQEVNALSAVNSYGGSGPLFVDWTSAARAFRSGPKKATVVSIVDSSHRWTTDAWVYSPYLYLTTMTGGVTMQLETVWAPLISELTVAILLVWMGADEAHPTGDGAGAAGKSMAMLRRYKSTHKLETIAKEDHPLMNIFIVREMSLDTDTAVERNTVSTPVARNTLAKLMEARGPPIGSVLDRYAQDKAYKKLVVDQLRQILNNVVGAITVNPILGTLWRTICKDRTNEAREELVTLFSHQANELADSDERARLAAWLEESYNNVGLIQEEIESVPDNERFPLLFLDPTADFSPAGSTGDSDDPDERPLNKFTRSELLDIGRSCDANILKRLGKVLTRLTFVESERDLPEHVRGANGGLLVPYLPLAMASPDHHRRLWKILLHVVLPGTMLSARPAALLAALALRMGIAPLRDAADAELLEFRDRWNNIETTENWNVGCLRLLLGADKGYEQRIADGTTSRPSPESRILMEADRDLFKLLVDYKVLEQHLDATLDVETAWQPQKSTAASGPITVCTRCNLPRSVTVMARGGICGLCLGAVACKCIACAQATDHQERRECNVSKADDERTPKSWQQCCVPSCGAQYVVYNPQLLKVRAKCFYCRHGGDARGEKDAVPAPIVECSGCGSRIIWPEEYRPESLDIEAFKCSACVGGVRTVVSREATAREMSTENGFDWILKNTDGVIKSPLDRGSLFRIVSGCNLTTFAARVEVIPQDGIALTIKGMHVRNVVQVKDQLREYVRGRKGVAALSCSLCFTDMSRHKLQPSCYRPGCNQLICKDCRAAWYGINTRGRLLNVAALHCAFCRRQPGRKAIKGYSITTIGGLRLALEDKGAWIYGWCNDCGFAKRYMERVCAAGAPVEVNQWRCEECVPPRPVYGVQAMSKVMGKVMECPGCGMMTEKDGGCDHISCPCGVHWCFACGEGAKDGHAIYGHIGRVHHGLEWEEGDWDEDDEEDEDDGGYV